MNLYVHVKGELRYALRRSYATILVPSMLTAPRYFSGEVEFGVITQVCLPSPHFCSNTCI